MKINYEPLTIAVTDRDVVDMKRRYKVGPSKIIQSAIVFLLISSVSPLLIFVTLSSTSVGGWSAVVGLGILVVFTVLAVYYANKYQTAKWSKLVHLHGFAESNGFQYKPLALGPVSDGIIFNIGHNRSLTDVISGTYLTPFEVANYSYIVGSGKNQHKVDFGYIMVQFERNLPHMVLDSVKNNTNLLGFSISNLPVVLNKNQKLSLEGDFDSYFTLYAPKEYERDALCVFTPDLMALLIDESSNFDAEVIDDKLYFYSKQPFNMSSQTDLARVFKIIDTLSAKVKAQTENYVDMNVVGRALNVVAEPGRRLKRGFSWFAVIIAIIYAVYIFYGMFSVR
jgi:hypothetical protein